MKKEEFYAFTYLVSLFCSYVISPFILYQMFGVVAAGGVILARLVANRLRAYGIIFLLEMIPFVVVVADLSFLYKAAIIFLGVFNLKGMFTAGRMMMKEQEERQ